MKNSPSVIIDDYQEPIERVEYDFGLNRRCFVQILSTGLLIVANVSPALAQRRGGGRGPRGPRNLSGRIHLGKDGTITVFTGKVEAGQGARAELTLAAAEELRVSPGSIQLVMADTALVPDDGITAGSRSTPSTVPAIRHAAAAARELLIEFAAKTWAADLKSIQVRDGKATDGASGSLGYADLAGDAEAAQKFAQASPDNPSLTATKDWKSLGTPLLRPNGRDIVLGKHEYPSDIARPGMLYGKVLRAPAYGAKLLSIHLAPAKAMPGVVVVQDDQFVGLAAPTNAQAEQALEAISRTAKWETKPQVSSKELFSYLKAHAEGGIPANPFVDEQAQSKQVLRQSYNVAYVQHCPLEPRAAVAEWNGEELTVWTGSQNPFGCRGELARAFHLPEDKVRLIVPDFGAGYGGKHSGEAGVETARLAKAAGKPVSLRWTRKEEFTWAYFRPAAFIQIEASLNPQDELTSWYYVNVNSGPSAKDTPYKTGKSRCDYLGAEAPPLRHGSYRGLAATANNFARESFMDELAAAAGVDPLQFRLAHLENLRLRAVLETAAQRFNWKERVKAKSPNSGVGLACGTEKGSYVAACAEITVENGRIAVKQICQVFECGAILNPTNLFSQVQGAIIMGLGPALREEMQFENGEIINPGFRKYQVPRFADLPEFDIHLLNRPDLESAGAGETPIIAIAPAIANALFHATGNRVRQMPIRLPA